MGFWALRIPAAPETAEGLTNFLWEQGALGVVEEEAAGESPRLRAFFPESTSAPALVAAVGDYQESLAALGLLPAPAPVEIERLLEEAWASAWQQAFPPRAVGERLIVVPPWEVSSNALAPRLPVVIQPGRAFGTGQHGSTEGCLVLLEKAIGGRRPGVVLDIGTGTGILAVAAARLGAPGVCAIDVDPDAVGAARENAQRNGCAGKIQVALGGPESLRRTAAFDLVLANLLTRAHLTLAPHYARLLATGGALVLGGMLAGEEPEVAGALSPNGLVLDASIEIDGWVSLLLHREP
ncbi:MAG: 50S ribosomal protein L11 methyltransferase [Candidatus Rokubacteria bacterium]|nr:50S ribosomal protein L11 methyltransferase [Candidatus Rokubacteria bacterium]